MPKILFDIRYKIFKKLKALRFQPIHVYCLHHVCEHFDADSMCECDWMDIKKFQYSIEQMQHAGIHFISLVDAQRHLQHDRFRRQKYAVLTFDDGYASQKEIIPWLGSKDIPFTLFLNPGYFDGQHYRDNTKERYLNEQDLLEYEQKYSSLASYGMHGYEHVDVTKMTRKELSTFIKKSVTEMSSFKNMIPYWAYTWGHHTSMSDTILSEENLCLVLIDGENNYNDPTRIHRQLLR